MASSGDDTPPCHSEKRSKKNNDTTTSSCPTGRTKASLPCDAAGGHGACACAARAQTQALAPPIGAAAQEFIPGLGDVPAIDPAEEAFDQEERTIAEDVCTMTPPFGSGYFGINRLLPFAGPTPSIWEPQRTPNPAGGYTPYLMVDYHHHVAEIHRRRAQPLYDEPKDLRIEYRFQQPFHFDFYHHLVYLCYINKREALVV